ncbi:hypothetical protein TRSC58_07518 [Trypanosoma rangeli SC58]|uniref:Uncharacterized protein n=1 Tax=Trypanosoma rangeli SC58 TaxID=429131 RepID=A0A061IRW5_TRYRA|nr:hypothetical protein TRSC58_07518 [Trypanosoma rangeli SC58]
MRSGTGSAGVCNYLQEAAQVKDVVFNTGETCFFFSSLFFVSCFLLSLCPKAAAPPREQVERAGGRGRGRGDNWIVFAWLRSL